MHGLGWGVKLIFMSDENLTEPPLTHTANYMLFLTVWAMRYLS